MLKLKFASDTCQLSRMREQVRDCLEELNVPDMEAELIVLALDEACTNIIRHAYQGDDNRPIRLRIDRTKGCLECELRDYGESCDPERIRGRSLEDFRPGGLGVQIMHSAFDTVDFQPRPRGTRLRLVKRLADPS